MQIIVITPEKGTKNETGVINEMFDSGLQRLHLRKPDSSVEETRKYLRAIRREHHEKIVITNHYELYEEFELAGIHLNSSARRNETIRKNTGHIPPGVISTSYHNWQKIIDNEFPYGYVFISPVFDSISKKDYKADIDPAGAMKTKQKLAAMDRYCPQIVGLGGVGIVEISLLHGYGFDAAALLGSLWMSGNPVATLTRALKVGNSFNKQDA